MDFTIDFQALIEFIVAAVGVVWAVAQMRNNTEHNKEAINELKDLITKNSEETKAMLNSYRENQKDNLEREISHLKELISLSSTETRQDIQRLEARQNESNRIKERLAVTEASLKALHKRLDVDQPTITKLEG